MEFVGWLVAVVLGGVAFAGAALGMRVAHPAVRFAATRPGPRGWPPAFAAELVISFVLMSVVLALSNSRRLARWTPLCCGALVALFTVEQLVNGWRNGFADPEAKDAAP